MPDDQRRLLRLPEVLRRVPYSEGHIYRLEQAGEFPRRAHLGANRVVWLESEIDDWVDECLRQRKQD